VSVYYSWNSARIAAGMPEVRIHDLRHSFASFLVNAGRSLYEVQKILGHTRIDTTQRYAHLSQSTLLAAANAAVAEIGDLFLGEWLATIGRSTVHLNARTAFFREKIQRLH